MLLVANDDFASRPMEVGVVGLQLPEGGFAAVEASTVTVNPFAEIAAVIAADYFFIQLFGAQTVNVGEQAMAPVAVGGDPFLKVEVFFLQAISGTVFEKIEFAKEVEQSHGACSIEKRICSAFYDMSFC